MTQPTRIDMTCDTSRVDVNPPPTEPTPSSRHGTPLQTPPTPTPTPTLSLLRTGNGDGNGQEKATVQHLPTQTTYDAWAEVYDSDGNMLQAIDDAEMATLLPLFLDLVLESSIKGEKEGSGRAGEARDLRILDLGCGTGRNTAKLVGYKWDKDEEAEEAGMKVEVLGVDFSLGMIEVARRKLAAFLEHSASPSTSTSTSPAMMVKDVGNKSKLSLRLEHCDCFPTTTNTTNPFPSNTTFSLPLSSSNALISTLVLEHIPLPLFFTTLSTLLLPRGLALITNMHADMGSRSQAGFVNSAGVKVRGTSFVYTVAEVLETARQTGFEVLQIRERAVRSEDLERGVVGRRGGKWVGVKVWVGVVVRKL